MYRTVTPLPRNQTIKQVILLETYTGKSRQSGMDVKTFGPTMKPGPTRYIHHLDTGQTRSHKDTVTSNYQYHSCDLVLTVPTS